MARHNFYDWQLTEFPNEGGLDSIGGPFPIDDVAVLVYVESKLLHALRNKVCQTRWGFEESKAGWWEVTFENLSRPPSVSFSVLIHSWALA